MLNMIRMTGLCLLIAALSACGGGDGFSGGTDPDTGGGSPPPTTAPGVASSSLVLLVSSPQMASDGSNTVSLTALVRDANNNFVPDADITFAATSGGVKVLEGTTDEDGKATAQLTTGGDPTNRTITVTAAEAASGLTATQLISVTGTQITITGTKNLNVSGSTVLTIFVADSGGNGIPFKTVTLSSNLGNTFSATTLTTNAAGTVTATVTAAVAGTDAITATALGTTGSFSLVVAAPGSVSYGFTTPATTEPAIGSSLALQVCWTDGGTPQVGQSISLASTRGKLLSTGSPGSSYANLTTGADGCVSDSISSNIAGAAALTAVTSGGLTAVLDLEFVATTPASLKLQASPSVISAGQKSTVTATVRDANNNLVKNKTVYFSITTDPTSGTLSPPSGVTNSFGQASTIYTAGGTSSGRNEVALSAVVDGTTVSGTAVLTTTSRALHVALGTGNQMSNYSDTVYSLPYAAIVTNSAGAPVANQTVALTIWSYRYKKGQHYATFNLDGSFLAWDNDPGLDVLPAGTAPDGTLDTGIVATCDNEDRDTNGIFNAPEDLNSNSVLDTEDTNGNGILDTGEDINGNGKLDFEDRNGNGVLDMTGPDVDVNGNGRLDPGNIATIGGQTTTLVTTNSDGVAAFQVLYPEEYAYWLEVEMEARVTVDGTEDVTQVRFILPGVADDFTDENKAPPGATSPFGRGYDQATDTAQGCSVDE
ncbi:MAG: Ig-like domain-containing protein [Pseudomonadota bacterium]